MNEEKQKTNSFKIFAKNTNKTQKNHQKNIQLENDGSLLIEGLASTTNPDLEHDIIEQSCIESMKQQAVGLNLYMDHNVYDTQEIIGAITEVTDTDEDSLHIKARIRPKYAGEVKEMLDTGINLGLSISGDITSYTDNTDDAGWTIHDINLFEISLTGMPANWDTFGTVTTSKNLVESTCLTGACYEILKQKNTNNDSDSDLKTIMAKKKTKTNKNDVPVSDEGAENITRQEAVDLFNQLSAESSEQIKADIIEEIKPQLKNIIEEKLGEQAEPVTEEVDAPVDGESNDGEGVSESKAKPEEEEEDEDEPVEETPTEDEPSDEETEETETDDEDGGVEPTPNEKEDEDEDEDDDKKDKTSEETLIDAIGELKDLISELVESKTSNSKSINKNIECFIYVCTLNLISTININLLYYNFIGGLNFG